MKFSIIITHYNRPNLVINTINSFKNLIDKEIIIIDACSSEKKLEELKKMISTLNNINEIKIIESNKRLTVSMARNKGIDIANGEWIYFMDDDDEARKKFIKFLNKNKLNKKYDFYRFPNIERLNNKNKMLILKWWYKYYSPQVSTWLFNSNFLKSKNIKFNENVNYGEDFEFMIHVFDQEKIKSKYIHCFAFYYNKFTSVESMMRIKEEDPSNKNLVVRTLLNSSYKRKKIAALEFLVMDYHFSYKKGTYSNEKKTRKIYFDYYKQISPNFKTWIKMGFIWKLMFIPFFFFIKKKNY